MKPEDILGALVTHSNKFNVGPADPIVLAAREDKIGKAKPCNWRLFGNKHKRIEIEHEGETIEYLSYAELNDRKRSAMGSQSRRRSTYSIEEIAADGLVGMYERNRDAIYIALGIGYASIPVTRTRLLRHANRMKTVRIWPGDLNRKPTGGKYFKDLAEGWSRAEDYVPDLVNLSIVHLARPFELRTEKSRADLFGVSESTWHEKVKRPFDQVAAHLWSWFYGGIGHIQHRILQRGHRLE